MQTRVKPQRPMFSSDYLRVGAVILDLEAERVPIAITFGHRRVGIGESDRGDPIAALRIRLGLDDPCESHIGNPIIDEGDVAHPRLDDCRSEEHTSELQSLMRIPYAV